MGDNGESDEGNDRTSITLSKGSHEEAAEIKPDGVTWDWFVVEAAKAWKEQNG